MLEVLKFVEVKDVLTHTSCVSLQWLRLSDSDELWHSYCDLEGISAFDIANYANCPKQTYKNIPNLQIYNLVVKGEELLKLFNCRTCEFLLVRPMQISPSSSVVMVRNHQIFSTGGQQTPKLAFLYDFNKNITEKYPDTLDPKRYHGSARIHRTVYIFGGDFSLGNAAAKCFLPQKRWTKLPSMPIRRSAFTPCVRKKCIYLCGGNVSISHVFHADTEAYTELPFALPIGTWCASTWVHDDLVIENQRYRVKWNETEGLKWWDVGRDLYL